MIGEFDTCLLTGDMPLMDFPYGLIIPTSVGIMFAVLTGLVVLLELLKLGLLDVPEANDVIRESMYDFVIGEMVAAADDGAFDSFVCRCVILLIFPEIISGSLDLFILMNPLNTSTLNDLLTSS